jgi:hypothetical protein
MTVAFRTRIAAPFLFAAAFSLPATTQAPAPHTTEWENEALKLRLFYPSDLVKGDPAQIMHGGHPTLFGISGPTDPTLAESTKCLRPALLLELHPSGGPPTRATTATILLAELDIDCLNGEHESSTTTLLNDIAEIVTKVPGMKSIAQPATYTVGWQKVHMAAAQGQLQTQNQIQDPLPVPSQLYTMGISTNWNNHLLVWYFTSNNIDTLNRITKTTVRFGRDQAAPLYPLTIGNARP